MEHEPVTVTTTLRDALRAVRTANPDAIRAIDDDDRRQAEQAAAEAKHRADLAEKVDKRLAERTDAIVADFVALEQEAIHDAAARLARQQLEAELGVTDPAILAMTAGIPGRLNRSGVESSLKRLAGSAPLPWRKGAPSATAYRTEMAIAAVDAVQAPRALSASEAADLAEQRRVELEQRRQARIA